MNLERSHERLDAVALNAYDGRSDIRHAQLEVPFESPRVCVAHVDLPDTAALAAAQPNAPTRHGRSPA